MLGWGGSCRDGVGHTAVGWSGSCIKQPQKNDSPENQDMTLPKSFWKGYKIQILNIKKN